ncbi:siderophore ABC transporter ATP-binding protein CdtA [Saccharothrix violaceirubra]|uniref:Iron complex transport system ATP-binding protein n=1 Tax=Saccharothrix violaceirubra TaxID=413306 RepID=A0A7W7T7X3_9PSEU|nr:ABC transporter ATP-binding protein [Saccharothrix violaceirubra]MBB4968155.1 iron complex transport system ATP-binding protein [Saccharothrix violaceirubra]
MTDTLLAGRDLVLAHHGTAVVHGVSLDLRAGTVTALVGPNGSGKSTLLRSLARLHRPADGAVHVDGAHAESLSGKEFARAVTLLTQQRPTPAGVSVRDVVGYGRHPYRAGWRGVDVDGVRAVERAMALCGVTAMAGRGVDELSGGELQRVWLASCLAQHTSVLLLDEPTNHLDLRYQVEVLDVVRDLADEGVAIGVVLHDLDHAALVADHVVLLREGRALATGTPAEVLTEAHLTDAYGVTVRVTHDPETGAPHCRPVGRHAPRS